MWRRLIHNLTAGLFPAVIRKETKEEQQEMAKYLIVGLGNIGDEYQHTRHNIGFDIIDTFAESVGATWQDRRYGMVATCRVKSAQLVLLKPSTYMNLSGNAVRYWLQQEKVPVENLLVLVDDLNIPFGKLRIRKAGSNGGHNGLGHIQQVLGTDAYARVRFGIGNEYTKGRQINFVLGEWTDEEKQALPERLKIAAEIIPSFCLQGIDRTMNQYNNK
jgi:PTH1 family peptidyl-tRNA hydrolase